MQVTVQHSLPPEEARKRLDRFAGRLQQQFPNDAHNLTQQWTGETCLVSGKIRGFSVACNLQVTPGQVSAEGSLPWLARPFQGVIEDAVRRGLEQALADR